METDTVNGHEYHMRYIPTIARAVMATAKNAQQR